MYRWKLHFINLSPKSIVCRKLVNFTFVHFLINRAYFLSLMSPLFPSSIINYIWFGFHCCYTFVILVYALFNSWLHYFAFLDGWYAGFLMPYAITVNITNDSDCLQQEWKAGRIFTTRSYVLYILLFIFAYHCFLNVFFQYAYFAENKFVYGYSFDCELYRL